ncbi:hypothetical protein [Persicimonas caeni]|uniref:hypothetical protein n=1 Tax=Persicimonas caeni TaxID=2292766 RepID=UPI00143D92C8|nr:hypothetical protein [Persicimonas caeni]
MTPLQLPFAHLNLRRNPFGEVPPEERGRLAVVDVERFVPKLAAPGFVVEFVGDCGRGKTTHLRALWDRSPNAPFVKVPEKARGFDVPDAPLVFVDEAQFLGRWQRRRTFRGERSFAVGTHESLAKVYERAGLDWIMIEVGGVDAERVRQMIERRLEWARREPGPLPQVTNAAIAAMLERHGDDLRAIEHHLYEVFQRLEEIRDVEVHHLGRAG